MKIKQVIDRLNLQVIVPPRRDYEVMGGYTGDLLSQVVSKAGSSFIWITIHNHLNVVAVASLLNLAGVIIAEDIKPAAETVDKALTEGVCLLSSSDTSFEVAGELYLLLGYGVGLCSR